MIHIAVLRGGPSSEYEVSLQSGASVLNSLPSDKYVVSDILISRDGVWHKRGLPVKPHSVLHSVDVVFNAMHGEYGEDGTVQKVLEEHGVPYTGSRVFASAIAMDKAKTKEVLKNLPGIKMQPSLTFHPEKVYDLDAEAHRLFSSFGPPYIFKPQRGGSSVGLTLVKTLREVSGTLGELLKRGPVIVEPYIKGREATCGVIEGLRGEELYALPPVEIRIPEGKAVFDYDAKYSGETEEIVPGNFTEKQKETLQNAAKEVHKRLGLRHYSRSDFIVTPNGIYFLEVNTLPGLTNASLLPKSVEAIGISFEEFLDHLISQALLKKRAQ